MIDGQRNSIPHNLMNLVVKTIVLSLLAICGGVVMRAETALFLFGGPTSPFRGEFHRLHSENQSYVVPISDLVQIATLRDYLARREKGLEPRTMLATLRLALGSDSINRNYAAPGAPFWDWHVAEIVSIGRSQFDVITADVRTTRDGAPSDMKAFITGERYTPRPVPPPLDPPVPIVNLIYYPLQMELVGGETGKVVNVSNRGVVGDGEKALITGFVIEGATPRNVVIRALGPTLLKFGLHEPLMDPMLELYRGSERIAVNDTWLKTSLNLNYSLPRLEALPLAPWAPDDPREPAFRLSLPPGAYTVVVRPEGDTAPGIALVEVYTTD